MRKEWVLWLTDPEEGQAIGKTVGKRESLDTSSSRKKRQGTLGLNSLSPFQAVQDSNHRMVPPTVEVGLPTSASCR